MIFSRRTLLCILYYYSNIKFQSLQTPGPGAYAPEKVKNIYESAPSYSLAARTKGPGTQSSPGPAAYVLSGKFIEYFQLKT